MSLNVVPRSLLPKSGAVPSQLPSRDMLAVSGEAPSKRRCISNACMPCRKRKSKCDGAQPVCHTCTTTYHSECYYDIDSDHRRKGALRRDIGQLKENLGSRNIILDAIRKGSQADADEIVELIRSNPDDSWDAIAGRIEKHSLGATEKMPPTTYLEGEVDSYSAKPSANPGDTGQYGHTSNLSTLPDDNPTSEINQGGNWTNVTDDNELIKHLLDVYLAWFHPLYLLFSEEAFLRGMQDRKLKYCTPLLVNAVLAIGCHFSDLPEARADPTDPSTLGDHFFAEAVRLLQENNRTSLTNAQALALMSMHQAMNNHDSSGWVYMWQAMGMVTELGLHTDQPTQSNKNMTESEVAARRITFWGCYFVQTVWGMCVGRISMLPRAAIGIKKQSTLDHLESRIWRPYGHPNFPGSASRLAQPSLKYVFHLHSSLLNEIVDDVLQLFYGSRDRITSRKLHLHHAKFIQWHEALPESLAIKDTPTLPHVIALHVYYNNCVIQLFRPFLRYDFIQNTRTPRQIATEAANKISELIALHDQTYGPRRTVFIYTHCIATAAVIHLVTLSPPNVPPDIREQSEIHLANAIFALHEAHQRFPIAIRFLKAIRVMISKWFSITPERIKEAMASVDMGTPTSTRSNSPDPSSSSYSDHINDTNQMVIDHRKSLAPDLKPRLNGANLSNQSKPRSQTPNHQSISGNPFSLTIEGVPSTLSPEQHIQVDEYTNSTSIPDPVNTLDWSQLNRDGFTISDGGAHPALWEVNWENYLGQ